MVAFATCRLRPCEIKIFWVNPRASCSAGLQTLVSCLIRRLFPFISHIGKILASEETVALESFFFNLYLKCDLLPRINCSLFDNAVLSSFLHQPTFNLLC